VFTVGGRSYANEDEAQLRIEQIDAEHRDSLIEPGSPAHTEWNELNRYVEQMRGRRRRLAELATDPRRTEGPIEPDFGRSDRGPRPVVGEASAERSGGLRTVERYSNSGHLRSEAADTLDRLIRDPKDSMGLSARYLEAVGDPDYFNAFGKMIDDPTGGHNRFTPAEVTAVQKVSEIEKLRGLVTGTGSAGGFALPIVIDPSILLTSSGALNPIRQVARVITTNTTEWRGVSSAGVVASYDAEASEVSDDTPTLAQPVINTEMARVFVPFSIEVGMDWTSIQTELLTLCADARDVLDATMFYSGTGTDQPFGVKTGLTTTQRVQTAGAGAFAYGDVYTLKQAIRPRDIANATFALHPNRVDDVHRFVAAGDTTDAVLMDEARTAILGKPIVEWTSVPTAVTTGTTIALYGDFRAGYTIVDRIGMSAEIVPHLFGATRRPTGERGLFAYWRCGAKVVVPESLRYLEAL
jgi:HK97 family phage major capsid protein